MNFFVSDLRRNIIKVVCLTVGLAVGILLVAKIYFDLSFDSSYPRARNIYIVTESVEVDGDFRQYPQTAGGVAPLMKAWLPQIEVATRSTPILGPSAIRLADDRQFEVEGVSLADSCFFDVFGTEISQGNVHQALGDLNYCMIPRSLADKIGGDVVGLTISSPQMPGYMATIGGVYEDFLLNSSIENRVYLSLSSIGAFMWDGRDNLLGNDRYVSYLRLADGTNPADLQPQIHKMIVENVDREAVEVFHFNLDMTPLMGNYKSRESVKTMLWVMELLAVVMLMSAALNYLLIVIAQMGRRSREMAIRKCFGTSAPKIFGRVLGESAFFLLLSTGLAVLLAYCFSDETARLLGYTTAQLLSTGRVWIFEACVCLVLLVVTGVVPAWMYCRTPVARAFAGDVARRRGWKMALLAVQFFASAVLACLLVLVGCQYYMVSHADMGFDAENVGYLYAEQLSSENRATLSGELRRLACVEGVASSDIDFADKAAGNNVWLGDGRSKQINVADLYFSEPAIVDVLGMRMTAGELFRQNSDTISRQVIVEERFKDVLARLGADTTNIVGQAFNITEHGFDGSNEFVVVGVIDNMRRNGFNLDYADTRAAVMFPASKVRGMIYVRFHDMTPQALKEAQAVIDRVCPGNEVYIGSFKARIDNLNEPVKRFGTSVMVVGLAIIVIALIGLVGFINDEVQRRAKEIAIRKVTGTSAPRIVALLCKDVLMVAVPSLLAGAAVAMIVGKKWLSQFTEQVSLSPFAMLVCLAVLLVVVVGVVALSSFKVANSNPVDYLRDE